VEHTGYFDTFLRDTVNLPKGRLEFLCDRVEKIYKAIKNDCDLGTTVRGKTPQGSWPQRTIIKPRDGEEFDADFLLELDENPDWADTPAKYNDALFDALDIHPVYGEMELERKNRCVRVIYANDMHVDVVPYIVLANGEEKIVNRDANDGDGEFEDTDPAAFTQWMKDHDDDADGNLRRVIRIAKYLRDHRDYYEDTVSIILTTVLGERVDADKVLDDPDYYANVPTTLLHLVQDLNTWLEANPTLPEIEDPSGSGTTFTHRWSQAKYDAFSRDIATLAIAITDAYDEIDFDTSVDKWQDIFGDGFKAPKTSSSSGKFKTPAAGAAAGAAAQESSTSRGGRAG
jgi:hypothetical protein